MPYVCPECGSSYISKDGRTIYCSQCKAKIAELDEPEIRKVVGPRCRI